MKRCLAIFFVVTSLTVSASGIALATEASNGARPTAPLLTCSTPLVLHDGASQTGATASVSTRGQWINLNALGFDNKTSSYTVGACSIVMAAQSGGQGNHYPRCLYAGCAENTMLAGWNNVISSVFLN